MSERKPHLLLTCEHASNRIPRMFRQAFSHAGPVLDTHRGWDLGAAELATCLARSLGTPLLRGRWSRLLVDLNRSPHHRALWSEYSKLLPPRTRQSLFRSYYLAYRERVETVIKEHLHRGGNVLHLSVHSFTPVLDGTVRQADVGLLYDPAREREAAFCERWGKLLKDRAPSLRVRRNHPYRGVADGLTTSMRRKHSGRRYLGIELEFNQRLIMSPNAGWGDLQRMIATTLREVLGGWRQ